MVDLLLQHEPLLKLVESFYDRHSSKKIIANNGIQLIAQLYKKKSERKANSINLNELRYKRFQKAAHSGSFDFKNLPPTEAAASQHC